MTLPHGGMKVLGIWGDVGDPGDVDFEGAIRQEISTWTMCGIMTTAKRPTTKQTETDGEGIELLLFCLLI